MKLKIEIEMDNQAFEEDPAAEVKWILEGLAGSPLRAMCVNAQLGRPAEEREKVLRDSNGNRVGFARVEDSPPGPGVNPATGKPFKAAPWETQ